MGESTSGKNFPHVSRKAGRESKKAKTVIFPMKFRVLQKYFVTLRLEMEQRHNREEKMKAFGRMLDVLDTLREKCPWDRKQTNDSLRPNTIEETYELCDALAKDDIDDICKELGDVLLHIAFYARIGEEKGQFDMADVCNRLVDKLVFRHPHVYHPSQVGQPNPRPLPYGEELGKSEFSEVGNVEQVLDNWEQIKQREKDGNKTVLSGVPTALPSLIKAYRIQDKARHVGFDWEERSDVWKKVREELGELEAELQAGDAVRAEQELGDFLFSVINAARLYKLNPDNALESTNRKFISRFNYIEQQAARQGRALTEMTLEEMGALWEEAKRQMASKQQQS
jgi:XTP/dITP diphosphohydrolase